MTDFQSSSCYNHLECFKEQLSEIEDIVEALGKTNTTAIAKYINIELDILKSIVNTKHKNDE
jgi:hypothetical protein